MRPFCSMWLVHHNIKLIWPLLFWNSLSIGMLVIMLVLAILLLSLWGNAFCVLKCFACKTCQNKVFIRKIHKLQYIYVVFAFDITLTLESLKCCDLFWCTSYMPCCLLTFVLYLYENHNNIIYFCIIPSFIIILSFCLGCIRLSLS